MRLCSCIEQISLTSSITYRMRPSPTLQVCGLTSMLTVTFPPKDKLRCLCELHELLLEMKSLITKVTSTLQYDADSITESISLYDLSYFNDSDQSLSMSTLKTFLPPSLIKQCVCVCVPVVCSICLTMLKSPG